MAGPKLVRFLIVLVVTLGSFTYGYCSSIIGTTATQPSFIQYFSLDKRDNANALFGAINGLFSTGGLFGALSSCFAADKYGRRVALCIGSVFAVMGGALQAGSVDIAMYLVARLVTGVGVGTMFSSLLLMPYAEICRHARNACPFVPERMLTTENQRLACWHARHPDLLRVYRSIMGRRRILLRPC